MATTYESELEEEFETELEDEFEAEGEEEFGGILNAIGGLLGEEEGEEEWETEAEGEEEFGAILNTLGIGLAATVITTALAVPFAFALAQKELAGS